MPKPSFIIIGSERCGTTSLFANICLHSKVCYAYNKEIEFFDKHYHKGFSWYEAQFNDGFIGEATPTYFWNPAVPERIYDYDPRIKLIHISRNKDHAIRSKYNQQVTKGVETLSFYHAKEFESIRIKGELERAKHLPYNYYPALYSEFSYQDRYEYEKHLSNWTPYFPNILQITLEELSQYPQQTMDKVFEYLALPSEAHKWEHLNKGIDANS